MCTAGRGRRLQRRNGEPVPARASEPGRLIRRGDSRLPASRAGSAAAPQAQSHDPQAEGGLSWGSPQTVWRSLPALCTRGAAAHAVQPYAGPVSAKWNRSSGPSKVLDRCKLACRCALTAPNGTMSVVALTALTLCMWLLHAWGCWQGGCDVLLFCVPAGCPAAEGAAGQLCEMGRSRRAAVRGPVCAVGSRVC